jgi:hypothetical protein
MSMPHNPRRAFDDTRNEIPPVTVGQSKAISEKTVMACCEAQGAKRSVP